jgi:hypothetical protein
MLAAALAASVKDGTDGDEDAALARALAASAAAWRCGACTVENVGDGVQVSILGGGFGPCGVWVVVYV